MCWVVLCGRIFWVLEFGNFPESSPRPEGTVEKLGILADGRSSVLRSSPFNEWVALLGLS